MIIWILSLGRISPSVASFPADTRFGMDESVTFGGGDREEMCRFPLLVHGVFSLFSMLKSGMYVS